ncbi:hypothetical protein KGF56_004236 [Candida oxycetoniae]|uniref:Bud site selection protein RAX2 n=1 Tax=Candida oxycetoniae TaxID=497107 RepID=A0AAI9SUL1_9ASCO|nr:uncharacterized protein KGF56_004236 [Candida oxycetoniae]KAI3402983.2 hypothetical protein KGF56_004236 [Candida oxycetoniae]
MLPVAQPQLDYNSFGNRIGFFGAFSGASFYNHVGASNLVALPSLPAIESSSSSSSSPHSTTLYLQDNINNYTLKLGDLDGQINQLFKLSSDTIVINGDFTNFNYKSVKSPIIYNITLNSTTEIIPSNDFNGHVNTLFVDNELIYLGGNFTFNNTIGIAIYNQTSKRLLSTPFQGFGENASINSISKVVSSKDKDKDKDKDDANSGSIIFGGRFNTLGLSDLLVHNISTNNTRNDNFTNTSIVNAEQLISLKHGTFTTVNGQNSNNDNQDDASLIICPFNNHQWTAIPNSGAEWKVELADEMKGIIPTKARIYIPDSANGVKSFRIYSFPNNGIMNLTFIDPSTNEVSFCDASCPLTAFNDLNDYIERNKDNATNLNEDDTFVDDDDGTFFKYYDPSTKTKNIGYGSNFQEFAFINQVGFDSLGLTITEWYGEQGVISGFELYQNAITVYGNNTLNDPNCNTDDDDNNGDSNHNNYAEIVSGSFQSARSAVAAAAAAINNDYLVTFDTNAKMILYPNVSYSGDYSIIMTTPGCSLDNTCAQRATVNVSVIGIDGTILSTNLIYQDNENMKFDYLYQGHLESSDDSTNVNRIEISYHSSAKPEAQNPIMVVDKIVANIVSLDSYYFRNSTNTTRSSLGSDLVHLELNGLFEYSLANFSNFDENLVHYQQDNRTLISLNNTFVGNSSINVLSSRLANNSEINEIVVYDQSMLFLLGNLFSDSTNLTLTNDNLISLNISSYNSVSNETSINLPTSLKKKRRMRRRKRDSQIVNGVTFNNTISKIAVLADGIIYLGQFSAVSSDSSFQDLSNQNRSTSQANNIALFSNNQWFSFGNDFEDVQFDQFANTTINGDEYLIFSSSKQESVFKAWDKTNSKWFDRELNLTHAIYLNNNNNNDQQILGGSGFSIMDIYNNDQGYIQDAHFNKFGINVNYTIEENGGNNNFISKSFYVNDSLTVISGKFQSDDVQNIGFIDNKTPSNEIKPLLGDIEWNDETNSIIETLYVDDANEYLFIGINGSVLVNGENITGLVIYDLQNNTFASFQPAALSNNNNDPIHINSMVLYDDDAKLLVGGQFDTAGSLSCPSLCIYDIANTRWINPQSEAEQSSTISGIVTDMKFYHSSQVLIAGVNLTLNNNDVVFMTYNFDNGAFNTKASLNKLNKGVDRFVLNDQSNSELNGRMIAMGTGYLSGFDGSNWNNIDQELSFNNQTRLNDLKLLTLTKSSSYNQTLFSNNKILLVAGTFFLANYGLVNMALFNGTSWIPYVYTTSQVDNAFIGDIQSILIDDPYRFQSSNDLKNLQHYLSTGKVVGISLACALGSTALLGLLYIIPYFALLRNRNGYMQRIQESDMVQAINPEDLLHEMDLQREK